ncbi:hypothetical protein CRG98_027451 [Punica granatum]|uniref:Uncharacterized protein n=1 Tax=Punica granatum TaxID=22663 RepID=A0A2I0J7D6_PUNGR|nr:hypothetical protein CRG98_027451 [Punica granatum]
MTHLEGFPSGVAKLYEPEFNLVGARMRARSHGLGVSTFPWGRVTDTREKKSPLPIYDPKIEGWNSEFRVSITCRPISRIPFWYSTCLKLAIFIFIYHLD